MRICLVSTGSIGNDPRATAEAESLRSSGHEVIGATAARHDEPSWVRTTPAGRRFRRPDSHRDLVELASGLRADLYQSLHPTALPAANEAAARAGGYLVRLPGWPAEEERDLIAHAPGDPALSVPATGLLPEHHVPGAGSPNRPTHRGKVVIGYRATGRNPGRYLESALRRAGLDVIAVEAIDWSEIDPDTRFVIVVESPLPALPVAGTNPGIPTVFWVHHGEHHLHANLRLQRRYGAHVVGLAHSWHLSHRFLGLVDRLPFGVASELFPAGFRPHSARSFDLAFVGARSGAQHTRRQGVIDRIAEGVDPERVSVLHDVGPEVMAEAYADARLVVDDGAGRHLPITMRVFEAMGGGALLLSQAAPGIEMLFDPTADFVPMGEWPVEQARDLLAGDTEPVARNGHSAAWRRHRYDDRVDEIVDIVERARQVDLDVPHPPPRASGLAGLVDRFADAQRVLDLEAGVGPALLDREVWPFERASDRAEPRTFHIAVVDGGAPPERERAVAAARLAVITPSIGADDIESLVRASHQDAVRIDDPAGTIFVFGRSGYRVSPQPDPQ